MSFYIGGFWLGMTLYCVDLPKLEPCCSEFPCLGGSASMSEENSSGDLGGRNEIAALLYTEG